MEPNKGDGKGKKLPPGITALDNSQKPEVTDTSPIEFIDTTKSRPGDSKIHELPEEGMIDEIKLSNLILSVKHMAIFAAERGILPDEIKLGEIYNIWNNKQENGVINKDEINLIARYYRLLEQILGDVTAFSLMATKCNNIDDCMKSDAGKYVKRQIYMVFGLLFVIVATYIFGHYYLKFSPFRFAGPYAEYSGFMVTIDLLYQLGQYLIPFTYGTLGAMAYILRYSVGRLHKREFDPRRIPGNYIRIVLGTICGGAIVMFVDSTGNSIGVEVTAAALGFLAGYSTDFLFGIVDRLRDSIDPQEEKKTSSPQIIPPAGPVQTDLPPDGGGGKTDDEGKAQTNAGSEETVSSDDTPKTEEENKEPKEDTKGTPVIAH